jgi:hypothetical protein
VIFKLWVVGDLALACSTWLEEETPTPHEAVKTTPPQTIYS